MYIFNAITEWICCCCLPCCKGTNDENDNVMGNDNGEGAPLLASSVSEDDRRTFLKKSEKLKGPGFTSGYTDYMHSNKAIRLFVFHAFIYYAVAVFLFSFLLDTKLSIISSLYFATVLFTTIGYGDVFSTSNLGRCATIALSCYGIVILGIFLGIYGEMVLDHHTSSENEQQAQVRKNVCEAMQKSTAASGLGTAGEGGVTMDHTASSNDTGKERNGQAGSAVPTEASPLNVSASDLADEPVNSSDLQNGIAERMKKKNQGSIFRDIFVFFLDELPILTLVTLIGLLIGYVEHWSIMRSLYWTFISGTTIGLGDEAPENEYARLGCVVFLPLCVAVLGEVLSRIAGIYLSRKRRNSQEEFFSRALTLADLETMDTDSDGQVDKSEFMGYMLVALQLVQQEDIDEIKTLFDALDKDNSGCLQKEDLQNLNWNESISRTFADVATSKEFQQLSRDAMPGKRSSVSVVLNKQGNALRRWADKAKLPGGSTPLPPINNNTLPVHTNAGNNNETNNVGE